MKRKSLTLSESIIALEAILEKAQVNKNRLGYFAAFIKRYAELMQNQTDTSEAFQLLSSRIIDAYVKHYENYEVMNEPVKSWMTTFDESSSWWTTIAQQYLMSILSFTELTIPKTFVQVKEALDTNDSLNAEYSLCFSLLEKEWRNVLSKLSVYSSFLSKIQKMKRFGSLGLNDFKTLEERSFAFALDLYSATKGERQRKLNLRDYDIHAKVEQLAHPNDIHKFRMKFIRLSERKSVKEVIALIVK